MREWSNGYRLENGLDGREFECSNPLPSARNGPDAVR